MSIASESSSIDDQIREASVRLSALRVKRETVAKQRRLELEARRAEYETVRTKLDERIAEVGGGGLSNPRDLAPFQQAVKARFGQKHLPPPYVLCRQAYLCRATYLHFLVHRRQIEMLELYGKQMEDFLEGELNALTATLEKHRGYRKVCDVIEEMRRKMMAEDCNDKQGKTNAIRSLAARWWASTKSRSPKWPMTRQPKYYELVPTSSSTRCIIAGDDDDGDDGDTVETILSNSNHSNFSSSGRWKNGTRSILSSRSWIRQRV